MNKQEWQAEEDKYLATLAQLAEQETWAKDNKYPLLAKAYSEGSRVLLNELSMLQKLRTKNQDDTEMMDFCSQVIELKAKGYFVEDMGQVHGPQFEGSYRWMRNGNQFEFQDGDVSYTEVEAWVDCIKWVCKG